MKKENALQALHMLDALLDEAASGQEMELLQAVKKTLLTMWRKHMCRRVNDSAFLSAVKSLDNENCSGIHQCERLTHIMLLLCEANIPVRCDAAKECFRLADQARFLQHWKHLLSMLCPEDPERKDDLLRRVVEHQKLLEDTFARMVTMKKQEDMRRLSVLRHEWRQQLLRLRNPHSTEEADYQLIETDLLSENVNNKIFSDNNEFDS